MRLAIAIILLVIVGIVIGAAGMFFAVSQPLHDPGDEMGEGDKRLASLIRDSSTKGD